jgi:hypothetical protein
VAATSHYTLYRATNNLFRFRLRNAKGRVVAERIVLKSTHGGIFCKVPLCPCLRAYFLEKIANKMLIQAKRLESDAGLPDEFVKKIEQNVAQAVFARN